MAAPVEQKLVTAEEFAQMANPPDGSRMELVNGEVVTMAPANEDHGRTGMGLAWRLAALVDESALGATYLAETGFVLGRDPDTVRAPDFAFTAASRLVRSKSFSEVVPDLVLEVVSPSDRPAAVVAKAIEWLSAGVVVVLVLWPDRQLLQVWRSPAEAVSLTPADTLTLPDVLPGLALPLARVFAPTVPPPAES